MENMIPFYLCEIADRQMEFPVRVEWLQFGGWGAQYRMRRKNHCSLDKVLQFPNVSGPAVSNKPVHRL